jgi:hypothetical protein
MNKMRYCLAHGFPAHAIPCLKLLELRKPLAGGKYAIEYVAAKRVGDLFLRTF